MPEEFKTNELKPCEGTQTKDWYAWINRMPPKPDDLHVVGEVLVSNPGVVPILAPKEPQGINENILQLNLFLYQKPGIWPRVMTWKSVKYDKMKNVDYSKVEILCDGEIITTIEVDDIH